MTGDGWNAEAYLGPGILRLSCCSMSDALDLLIQRCETTLVVPTGAGFCGKSG